MDVIHADSSFSGRLSDDDLDEDNGEDTPYDRPRPFVGQGEKQS